jgi:hypothetical protein
VKEELERRSLKPLAVPVKTAAKLLGLGTTSTWGLISTGRIDVIRIGRRTLVTVASLEALVARSASSPDHQSEELGESRNAGVEQGNSIRMTLEEVKSKLSAAGIFVASQTRLPNDMGTHIVTVYGQVVDVYDSGIAVVHGRAPARLTSVLGVRRIEQKGSGR